MKSGIALDGGANFFLAMKIIQAALFYCAALLLLAAPARVQAQFTFTTNNGAITITGYTGPGGAVTIPDNTNGWPVTSIGFAAFQNWASLTNVTIPDSVVTIGDYAFSGCASLAGITIPNSVTTIGDYAFQFCGGLTNFVIGTNVTSLGGGVFNSCNSLTEILVAAGNPDYSSLAGVLFTQDQSQLLQYPGGKTGDYTIPNSVTSIENNAFVDSLSLTSVTIPNSVTDIENNAFWGCASLASLTIGTNVTNIANSAFAWCNSLTGVFFQGNAPSAGWDLFTSDNKVTVYYLPDTIGWSSTFAGAPTTLWNPSVGFLQATIFPMVAIWAGAEWQVDYGTWQTSGTTMDNLSLGEHTVSFSAVAGWTTPAQPDGFCQFQLHRHRHRHL